MIRRTRCLLCSIELQPFEDGSDRQHHPDADDCEVRITDSFGISIELDEAAFVTLPDSTPSEDEIVIQTWPPADQVLGDVFTEHGLSRLGGVSSGRGWSSFSLFQKCPYAWKRRYLDEAKPALWSEAPALAIGTLVHAFLALYYAGMMPGNPYAHLTPEIVYERVKRRANPELVAEAWRVFVAYTRYYANEAIQPLAIEHDLKDPRTGESCRFDLIAFFADERPGLLPGTYIIESKCLPGSARIYDCMLGGYRRIDELFAKGIAPIVLSLDQTTNNLVETQASTPFANGVKDILKVSLESGRSLSCTENHPVLTPRGWVPVGAIKSGTWVAIPRSTGRKITQAPSLFGRFIGMLLGDGHVSSQLGFTQNPGPVLDAFISTADALGFAHTQSKTPAENDKRRTIQIRFSVGVGAPVQALMVRLGLIGHTSGDKFIPDELKHDEHAPSVIGGLWDTDGHIHIRSTDPIIGYSSKSRRLAGDVQELLLRLGIDSVITKSWATSWSGERNIYHLVKVVGRNSKRKFCESILNGLIPSARLHEKATKALTVIRPRDNESIPIELLRTALESGYKQFHWQDPKRTHIIGMLHRHRAGSAQAITRGVVENWAETIPELKAALWDVLWERVDSVIVAGREMTYDLTVPRHSNFVADDLLVHNTAGRFDQQTLLGWSNDGEIIGQVALWKRLGLDKRFGELRGVMMNIIGKQREPKFHRTIVSPSSWQLKSHLEDLKRWEGLMNLAKSMNSFPRSRHSCIGRYGFCDHYEHCATNE